MIKLTLISALLLSSCTFTSHPTTPSQLGSPISISSMEAVLDQPSVIEVKTIASADWVANLSEVLNLDSPKAKAEGLVDREEPITVYAHLVRHPKYGYFLIDTGVSEKLLSKPSQAGVNWLIAKKVKLDRMKKLKSTDQILADLPEKLSGVFLTHLHPDHISGMAAIPDITPIYVGLGEAESKHFSHLFLRGTVDGILEGKGPLQEWQFKPDTLKTFAGVLDVFGDQSFFAISVPGHTHGSTAYLARTKNGPILFTGDVCHTRWGWDHTVEPGTSTEDIKANADSLKTLKSLVDRHPNIQVRLGHQQ